MQLSIAYATSQEKKSEMRAYRQFFLHICTKKLLKNVKNTLIYGAFLC